MKLLRALLYIIVAILETPGRIIVGIGWVFMAVVYQIQHKWTVVDWVIMRNDTRYGIRKNYNTWMHYIETGEFIV